MELFGSRRGDRKNASTDRSASGSEAGDLALTTPVQPATKKFSLGAILFGILAGIIGIAAGLFLGFALGAALAAAFHVSTFEGGAGYFAAAIAVLVTCIIAPGLVLLTLYWRGTRGFYLFVGLIAVCIWFWNLVCGPTACSEYQWPDAATGISSETTRWPVRRNSR